MSSVARHITPGNSQKSNSVRLYCMSTRRFLSPIPTCSIPRPTSSVGPTCSCPRLYGISPTDSQLTGADQLAIARALGQNLAQLHTLTWPFAGDYDLVSNTIQPFSGGFAQWIVADIRRWLALARENGTATTADDVRWTERVMVKCRAALAVEFQPCFVMNDYNPGNMLVNRVQDIWQVTGLFDLMEYYFGDGEADLMRLIAIYLDGASLTIGSWCMPLGQPILIADPRDRVLLSGIRFTCYATA